MRTEPLAPIRPGQLFPNRGDVNSILQMLNSLGAGGGAGIRNTPMGLSSPPMTPNYVYAEILGNDGAGFHSWQQIEFNQLSDGTWISGTTGIYGTTTENPLYELNGRNIPTGEVVEAKLGPGDRCWVTTFGGTSVTGSGSGAGTQVKITCADGTQHNYSISYTGTNWLVQPA